MAVSDAPRSDAEIVRSMRAASRKCHALPGRTAGRLASRPSSRRSCGPGAPSGAKATDEGPTLHRGDDELDEADVDSDRDVGQPARQPRTHYGASSSMLSLRANTRGTLTVRGASSAKLAVAVRTHGTVQRLGRPSFRMPRRGRRPSSRRTTILRRARAPGREPDPDHLAPPMRGRP
jgi:hypothetical protein